MAETLNSTETSKREYRYDAVIVLGGGLKKVSEAFYPTDYRDSDKFGMLGAGLRMVAALELYLTGQAKNFVFSTGITDKNIAKYGPDIPTEAYVYKDKFLRILRGLKRRVDYRDRFEGLDDPNVLEEDESSDTASNIEEILEMISSNKWERIAIVSSDYHLPRVETLYQKAVEIHLGLEVDIEFIGAEQLVKQIEPGKYDSVIQRYYGTPEAKKRIVNEQKGIEDFKS